MSSFDDAGLDATTKQEDTAEEPKVHPPAPPMVVVNKDFTDMYVNALTAYAQDGTSPRRDSTSPQATPRDANGMTMNAGELGASVWGQSLAASKPPVPGAVPRLAMSRVFSGTSNEEALKTSRDLLMTTHREVLTLRSARKGNTLTIEELRRQLEQSEENAIRCAETGMQLLDRIKELEEEAIDTFAQLEQVKGEHEKVVQDLRVANQEISHLKTGEIYATEELEYNRKLREQEKERDRAKMDDAQWLEKQAMEAMKHAKFLYQHAPALEFAELEARRALDLEEQAAWKLAIHQFMKWCISTSSLLYQGLLKASPHCRSDATPLKHTSTLVIKQSRWLGWWRLRFMKVLPDERRIIFTEISSKGKEAGRTESFKLSELKDIVTGSVVPAHKKAIALVNASSKRGVEINDPCSNSWSSGFSLVTSSRTFRLCVDSNDTAEMWINMLQGQLK